MHERERKTAFVLRGCFFFNDLHILCINFFFIKTSEPGVGGGPARRRDAKYITDICMDGREERRRAEKFQAPGD